MKQHQPADARPLREEEGGAERVWSRNEVKAHGSNFGNFPFTILREGRKSDGFSIANLSLPLIFCNSFRLPKRSPMGSANIKMREHLVCSSEMWILVEWQPFFHQASIMGKKTEVSWYKTKEISYWMTKDTNNARTSSLSLQPPA